MQTDLASFLLLALHLFKGLFWLLRYFCSRVLVFSYMSLYVACVCSGLQRLEKGMSAPITDIIYDCEP